MWETKKCGIKAKTQSKDKKRNFLPFFFIFLLRSIQLKDNILPSKSFTSIDTDVTDVKLSIVYEKKPFDYISTRQIVISVLHIFSPHPISLFLVHPKNIESGEFFCVIFVPFYIIILTFLRFVFCVCHLLSHRTGECIFSNHPTAAFNFRKCFA